MKKILLYALAALFAIPAFAQLNGNGYYRVQNAFTKRYAYLLDNKGSYDAGSFSADVAALKLYMDPEKMYSDPSSVFYVESAPQGNNYFDIWGQGTSIYTFMKEYLSIFEDRKPYDGQTSYTMYATKNGLAKYIGDIRDDLYMDEGFASVNCTGNDRKWYFHQLDASTPQYFGVAPSVEANGKYYAPLFGCFPFSAYSEGVRFYTISEIDPRGAAIINEVKGTVPAATPVIIECSSANHSDNRLNIGGTADKIGTNLLKGVYFDNPSKMHYNRTPFNKQTMRVLGIGKDGRLAFVRGDYEFVPRNQAYLQLTDPKQYDQDEFTLMTEEQREEELGAVAAIPATQTVTVYSLDGRLVKKSIAKSDVPSLGRGMYILKSAGTTEKMIVH